MAKTKKPLGKPLELSEQELDSLSSVSQADLIEATALWEAQAPKALKELLKAEVEEVRVSSTPLQGEN